MRSACKNFLTPSKAGRPARAPPRPFPARTRPRHKSNVTLWSLRTKIIPSTLISDFSNIHSMKTSNRIIIEHINHIPHGRDASDRLNEEFVVLENEGNEKISLAGWTLTDETATGARRHVYTFPDIVSLS